MRYLRVLSALLALAFVWAIPATNFAQQRRQQPRPVRKTVAPPASVPTFDTILSAGSYNLYFEVRNVGQLIRSNSVNEVLEPVLKLSDPPKEFKTFIKWLNTRADDVMNSRMFIATWPMNSKVPEALIAIEFSSAEEAAKFEPQLNGLLPKLLSTPAPQETPSPNPNAPNANFELKEKIESNPNYYLKQVGALILITPTPLNLKELKPARSKLLTEDPNFRTARNRFGSEQLFAYLDVDGITRSDQIRREEFQKEVDARVAEEAKQAANKPAEPVIVEQPKEVEVEVPQEAPATPTPEETPTPAPTPDPMSMALNSLGSSFFAGDGKMPNAVGFGLNLENDSFDVRALLLSSMGEKCDPIPFFPKLILGAPLVPESPSILPADTELFATVSLDFPQIYAALSKPQRSNRDEGNEVRTVSDTDVAGPFAQIEKQLHIKIKDDVLPLLGNEMVISLPMNVLEDGPIPTPVVNSQPNKNQSDKIAVGSAYVVGLSLRDREGMRVLLPKIIDSMGFKGASDFAQKEQHDNVELVSYQNALTYAFIDNFLVLSTDSNSVRHVVDSYLKHETLAGEAQFKNYTRWHPRQLQGEIYISPLLMEGYKKWAGQPDPSMSDDLREILSRLTLVAQPVSYALSNDGLGTMHELHIPKNLLLMAVAGMAAESNPSPVVRNERWAKTAVSMIASAEIEYKSGKGNGSFASLDQLIAEGLVEEDLIKTHGYKIDLMLVGDRFEITAVPNEYGKTGRTSYFIDHSHVLRGADHGGATASVDDNPIN
ncbi:MAG TPA: hypothetical protein VI306_24255 [Pyrinomonadaceae bacterium]